MTDRIEALLRELDPATVHRGDPMSPRAQAELAGFAALEAQRAENAQVPDSAADADGVGRSAVTPFVSPRRRPLRWFSRAAAVLLLAVAVVIAALQDTPAAALTPPLLTIDTAAVQSGDPAALTQQKWAELLAATQDAAARADGELEHAIRLKHWGLQDLWNDGAQRFEYVEVPVWREVVFNLDGSVHVREIAAEALPGQADDRLPAPGTVLWDETHTADGFRFSGQYDAPSTPDEWGPFLVWGTSRDDTGVDKVALLSSALERYPLTWVQRGALLEYLSTLDALTYEGSTTDRLGRAGEVFSAASEREKYLIVISPETGAVLSIETIVISDGDYFEDYFIAPETPYVLSYYAWEEPQVISLDEYAKPEPPGPPVNSVTEHLIARIEQLEAASLDDWELDGYLECLPVGGSTYCPWMGWYLGGTEPETLLEAAANQDPEIAKIPEVGSYQEIVDEMRAMPVADQRALLLQDLRDALARVLSG